MRAACAPTAAMQSCHARTGAGRLAARRTLVPAPLPAAAVAAAARSPRRGAALPVRVALDLGSGASLGHFIGAFALFYSSITWVNLRKARIEVRPAACTHCSPACLQQPPRLLGPAPHHAACPCIHTRPLAHVPSLSTPQQTEKILSQRAEFEKKRQERLAALGIAPGGAEAAAAAEPVETAAR